MVIIQASSSKLNMLGKSITAILNTQGYSDELKNHPVGKFIIDFTYTFDHAAAARFYHPTGATYIKSDGSSCNGEACYEQIVKGYSFFIKVYHEAGTLLLYDSIEVPGAYEVLGTANVHASLVGDPAPREPEKVKDRNGNKWHISFPGAFHFWIEKCEDAGRDGFAITKAIVHSDSGPVVARLLKRGVLKPSDVGL